MASRSLNKVMLIGNLTRDPELRYTPQGTPVCTMGIATNRSWTDSNNQRQESAEFHRLVAWNKLAELCDQLLFKGRKVYFEGRLQTRNWTGQDGQERQTTEIVVDDMIILDSKRKDGDNGNNQYGSSMPAPAAKPEVAAEKPAKDEKPAKAEKKETKKDDKKAVPKKDKKEKEELSADDIPF